jgi:hypothetical protein
LWLIHPLRGIRQRTSRGSTAGVPPSCGADYAPHKRRS